MGRTGQHLARQNRETGCVELADLLPRDGLGSGDVPGRLRAASDGKTVDGKRSIADNSPLGAADDRVDDDVSLEDCAARSLAIVRDTLTLSPTETESARATSSEMTA